MGHRPWALTGLSLGVLAAVPMPDRVRVKGVMQATQSQRALYSDSGGALVALKVRPGQLGGAGSSAAHPEQSRTGF
jgi:hypothetical protein